MYLYFPTSMDADSWVGVRVLILKSTVTLNSTFLSKYPSRLAVITAGPFFKAVILPLSSTLTTLALLLFQITFMPLVLSIIRYSKAFI